MTGVFDFLLLEIDKRTDTHLLVENLVEMTL